MHPATGLQNNLICESHPLLDRASDSIYNRGSARLSDDLHAIGPLSAVPATPIDGQPTVQPTEYLYIAAAEVNVLN